ncbi:hypothetical protein H6A12_00390 [Phocea massiliensis]|uniref:DUF304 domain-containing protein n=1 Tax=Merdimmobilis hominis TaxID=2897707 RepID=A0A938X573_9FIRM|nr:hypothetical protein [Merdimmobilis hominis]MBM6919627.1 hypothetical protein [Merdimmobilis hominis]
MDSMETENFAASYINDDEYVLWQGKPERGNLFSGRDIFLILFGIAWLSFCGFWEFTALQSNASPILVLWGIPFILVGLYLLFGQFIRRANMRGKTYYVITTRKILVKTGNRIQMYDGKDLPAMHIQLHKNGTGTIRFGEQYYTRRGAVYSCSCVLENIVDVAQVQNAIETMKSGEY